jgi:hypothetical protein
MPDTARGNYVTVVSGMPRSGTSLMMRMLDAGGIPALTDGRRAADRHNPLGYFEDDRVRRLASDNSWLGEAGGKAVKIIYRLLPHLPPHLEYRVLLMERDLQEVYESQQDMLQAANHPAAAQDDRIIEVLARELEKARQWLAAQPNIRCLAVSYGELVGAPQRPISAIARFLERTLDEAAMAAVVDPALYRHRPRGSSLG